MLFVIKKLTSYFIGVGHRLNIYYCAVSLGKCIYETFSSAFRLHLGNLIDSNSFNALVKVSHCSETCAYIFCFIQIKVTTTVAEILCCFSNHWYKETKKLRFTLILSLYVNVSIQLFQIPKSFNC